MCIRDRTQLSRYAICVSALSIAGYFPSLSPWYALSAVPMFLRLAFEVDEFAPSLTMLKTGNATEARMAIMTMTTRSSMRVNPERRAVLNGVCI